MYNHFSFLRYGRQYWLFLIIFILCFAVSLCHNNICLAAEKSTKIIILGDSLTAGYGLDEKDSFPAQLEKALHANDYAVTIVNAGLSGDTTAGGLERLDWVLTEKADILVIALGANDGLRGIDPQFTHKNLDMIIDRAQQINPAMKILLIGMLAPPNLGTEYAEQFNNIYPALAKKYDIALYPFFLDGVVANSALNQSDGIHPNPKGVERMVQNTLPFFKAALEPR